MAPLTGYSQPSPWDALQTPQEANPWDSRFGGPTPWQDSITQWANLGLPTPKRPFGGLGKFDITQSLPLAPVTPASRTAEPSQLPPPQPGLFEALGRGIPGLVTQFIPNGDLNQVVTGIGGFVGSLADLPFRAIPTIDLLEPGGYNVEGLFNQLPEDAEKRKYEALVASDPINRVRYMSQYLDRHGTEVAHHLGVSGVFAPMFTPAGSFAEQMRRLVFGALSAAGSGVARTYVGSTLRNVDESILNADPSTLPPELQDIQQRWKAGDFRSKDDLYDELTNGAFRWTNDSSLWGRATSMFLDIATDPIIWASFGMGSAASVSEGAIRLGQQAVAKAVGGAGLRETAIDESARLAGVARDVWTRNVPGGSYGINRGISEWARVNKPDLYEQGMRDLTGFQ